MFSNTPRITKNIIFLNIVLFVVSSFSKIDLTILLGGFYPESVNFKPYQIITHMFMHGGIMHIFFNMYVLFMFGPIVEQTIGEKKFFTLYSLGGLGSFVLFNFMNYVELNPLKEILISQGVDMAKFDIYSKLNFYFSDQSQISQNFSAWSATLPKEVSHQVAANWFMGLTNQMVGASGAISAVMTAFAVLYPENKLQLLFPPISFRAKYLIPITLGIDIYLGLQNNPGDNVAHFAHVGGAIVGIILAKIWKNNQFRVN